MPNDFTRYVLIALSLISSSLLTLLVWNIKTFITDFKNHILNDSAFAEEMLVLTSRLAESQKNVDQRLSRIETVLWRSLNAHS